MIRKSHEKTVATFENLYGGEGVTLIHKLLEGPEEMSGKGRVYSHATLQPGCSIGYHVHKGESETYYIYGGTAECNDNGTLVTVTAGDVTFTDAGEGHAIKNISTEPLVFIALVLYK